MAVDFLRHGDCTLFGPALPEPFVRFELERLLIRLTLLPRLTGEAGEAFTAQWRIFQRKLRDVSPNSGPIAIANRILEPLAHRLGYAKLEDASDVQTREGLEAGGRIMRCPDGAILRCWTVDFDADLDAPTKRGHAYRYSPTRVAQRVLLASGERLGLLTNGTQLRLLISDPARGESFVEFDLGLWSRARDLSDSYQLLWAIAGPAGVKVLPEIVEEARLKQNKVTKELRGQARLAVEEFVQCLLENDVNRERLARHSDKSALAKQLWHEGLILIYRLLFILKCESTSDPSRIFRFASSTLWRNTYSPSTALARTVRKVLDEGAHSGRFLEDGLRVLFRMFEKGVDFPGLTVRPLSGALFGPQSAPLLAELQWGEPAVAHLLDRLLWTTPRRGAASRERVHYGPLDVEDLGRVYEALLELEPGISTEPMCRLRRAKLEVVVPAAQGEKYRMAAAAPAPPESGIEDSESDVEDSGVDETDAAEDESPSTSRGKKTKVEWIEAIPPGRFYLRVGLGRKASGSYYTPHSFVRFLVQETLGPQCAERSPPGDPNPGAILKLKVLDPACGSGHFLVEACRFLAGKLYEAARQCDEKAAEAQLAVEAETDMAKKRALIEKADELRRRLKDLPDHDDELLAYLPSRSPGTGDGGSSSYADAKAQAICRRLVAVHCIYGADLNPLAVELAKLSLWIESHAEGLPLTFLDHRIVLGNSLTGPFWDKLTWYPGRQEPVQDLFRQNLDIQFMQRLGEALGLVRQLESGVGIDVDEVQRKQAVKAELDRKLAPFRILAAAWSGGVMLGTEAGEGQPRCDDEAYGDLLKHVGTSGELPATVEGANLRAMIAKGASALSYDLTFPEIFHPTGQPYGRYGFDAVIGNPPWDRLEVAEEEYWCRFDLNVLSVSDKDTRRPMIEAIAASNIGAVAGWRQLNESFFQDYRIHQALFLWQQVNVLGKATTGRPDMYRLFTERNSRLLGPSAITGVVVPSAFHANEGATGVRRLYLEKMSLRYCFSFENRNNLFEIDSRFKFAIVVAQNGKPTEQFTCAFYLHDDQWLFGDRTDSSVLVYSMLSVTTTGGAHVTFAECRTQVDADLLYRAHSPGTSELGTFTDSCLIDLAFGVELHRNRAFNRDMANPAYGDELPFVEHFAPQSGIPVFEGKGFNQFTDRGEHCVRVEAPLAVVLEKRKWRPALAYYRFAYRAVASSTNERSLICTLLRPGVICNHSIAVETSPERRAGALAAWLSAVLNSFFLDWQIRQRTGANISAFIFRSARIIDLFGTRSLLVHSCTRLTCNHAGYRPLWREQLGDAWREPGKAPFTWPVLAGDDERWAVRAAIDAVVAEAYELSREQYAHVLSTFSHASYKKAPELCLAAFDELKAIGLEAFCKKHDPYWDIPLNENLPQPVIDLPIPEDPADAADEPRLWTERSGQLTLNPPGPLFDTPAAPKRGRPRRKKPDQPDDARPDPAKVIVIRTQLEIRKTLTAADVQEHLQCDAEVARAVLRSLVESGAARKFGKGRGTRYEFAP